MTLFAPNVGFGSIDKVSNTKFCGRYWSVPGTFRRCRNVRLEPGMRTTADVRRPL